MSRKVMMYMNANNSWKHDSYIHKRGDEQVVSLGSDIITATFLRSDNMHEPHDNHLHGLYSRIV